VESCLVDTVLFKSLGPAGPASARELINTYGGALFLSEASVVHLRLAIGRIPSKWPHRHDLDKWLDCIVANFSDRIHSVDAQVASSAGAIMRNPFRRFHDALLVATARVHGHDLLTLRGEDFERWAKVTLVTFRSLAELGGGAIESATTLLPPTPS
jgi:predicted nucleic acid-binding protein